MFRACSSAVSIGLLIFSFGCGSGPKPPQPGTPEFIWAAAKSTYAAGDFQKAKDNLAQLAKGESEYATRARAMALVLSAGIAQGYIDLADNFESGARMNRANPTPFHRRVNLFRSQASAAAMESAELLHTFQASPKTDTVDLPFGYPTGSAAEPVQLQRVAKGMIVPDADIETLQRDMIQRGVLLAMTRAVGAPDDPAKTLEIFKAGEVKAARGVFLAAIVKSLCNQADVFTAKKLDQPAKLLTVIKEAEESAAELPAGKESKDLKTKILSLQKSAKRT